jgi:ketosteroid isomerase-like protein
MTKSSDELLETFAKAWDSRDVETVVSCFSDDGIYYASVGPDPGEKAVGRDAIRQLVKRMFEHDTGAKTQIVDRRVGPSGGYWTWIYTLSNGDIERGCDIISIDSGHVTLKDAYRKTR